MRLETAGLLLALLALPAAVPALRAQDELPAGKGKDVTQRMCSGCHDMSVVTGRHLTAKRWSDTVDEMIGRGATGTDAEIDQVINYLAAHFGRPVNVNTATAQDLQNGLSLSQKDSEAIVKYRQSKGNFRALTDVTSVPGVDAAQLEEQKANIQF